MDAIQAKPPSAAAHAFKLVLRAAMIVGMAFTVSLLLNRSAADMRAATAPAGFGRGVLHGALMPCAMPGLLLGRNLTIYAANNAGIPYKLGYTTGVNGCGALFFGVVFWRLSRWRKGR